MAKNTRFLGQLHFLEAIAHNMIFNQQPRRERRGMLFS